MNSWKVEEVSPSRKFRTAQDDCPGGRADTGTAGRVPAGRGGLLSCLWSSVQWDAAFSLAILSAALSHLTLAVCLGLSR